MKLSSPATPTAGLALIAFCALVTVLMDDHAARADSKLPPIVERLRTSVCTADVNVYYHPSQCGGCPAPYLYSPKDGKCHLDLNDHAPFSSRPTGKCTSEINSAGKPTMCPCPADLTYDPHDGLCHSRKP